MTKEMPIMMRKYRVKKVILEDLEGNETTLPFNYDNMDYCQEQGIKKIYGFGLESFGRPVDLKPNGQRRAIIKLWSGCNSYDSFVGEEISYI
jgi:hypothetical protein